MRDGLIRRPTAMAVRCATREGDTVSCVAGQQEAKRGLDPAFTT